LVEGEERLPLLEDCVRVLTALERWQEVLNYTNEALQLAPGSTFWQEVQQQVADRLGLNDTTLAAPSSAFKQLSVFVSYAHEDMVMFRALEKHLSPMTKGGFINTWHEGKVMAGEEWEETV